MTAVSEPLMSWMKLIVGTTDPGAAWTAIFARLRDLALANPSPRQLHKETILPDRLLAESAWDLWQGFSAYAPSVVNELKQFWVAKSAVPGTAVLILDGLSLRELPILVEAAKSRGIEPTRIDARGCEVPSETNRFASAIGLAQRSQLSGNAPPASFTFGGPDVYCDLQGAPFVDCIGSIPAAPRVFIWHEWPDDLIHHQEDKDDGPQVVAKATKADLSDDGFWQLVDRLRQGRRLVITGDHGYADADQFSSEVTHPETVKLLREFFGASRCVPERADRPWPALHVPPYVSKQNGYLVVIGQRKWKVQGGFPHLCHRGLSLLEAAVPFLELPAK